MYKGLAYESSAEFHGAGRPTGCCGCPKCRHCIITATQISGEDRCPALITGRLCQTESRARINVGHGAGNARSTHYPLTSALIRNLPSGR